MVKPVFSRFLRPSPPEVEARHHPSGFIWACEGYRLAFSDYVVQTRDMLYKAHAGRGVDALENIVDGNAPFDLKPLAGYPAGKDKTYRRGVLLTHGLSDSPYFMRHLGAFFQDHGFRVMAVLLPGHGTQPGDLLDAKWQEWAGAVTYGVDRLAEEVEEVFLAGFSAGGTLSLYQSLRDKRVCGLFLFSPALRISPRAALANFHKLYSWLIPSGKWLDLKQDHDIYKYESFPKNAAAQMYALTKETDKLLHRYRLDIPVFIAASADDATVDVSATLEFISQARHASNRMVLYTTDTTRIPSTDGNQEPENLELVSSVIPEQNILSYSHMSIVLPAEDRHYGVEGEYSNCTHYYPDDIEQYAACNNNPRADLQGELTEKNLKAGVLRRLMYNPKFLTLKVSMKEFIDNLP